MIRRLSAKKMVNPKATEMENREQRNIRSEVRYAEGSRRVEGYALLFDTPSDGLDFTETISRGALEGVLERSDVKAWLNHSPERGILARYRGGSEGNSLELEIDEKGLRYAFDAPHTALGDELIENLKRGDIDQSSFAFDVEEDKWTRNTDGTWSRSILQFGRLYDVSPVYDAAYSATSVNMRGKELAEEELARIEEEQRAAEDEARKAEEEAQRKAEEEAKKMPDSYYEEFMKQLNV